MKYDSSVYASNKMTRIFGFFLKRFYNGWNGSKGRLLLKVNWLKPGVNKTIVHTSSIFYLLISVTLKQQSLYVKQEYLFLTNENVTKSKIGGTMTRPTIHLICNAHLDPVWQWKWEEGVAETLSTFRCAVRLLREHDQFIFNHNESVLYQWVKKYDPKLFQEIQESVKQRRWHISGGWYLQPDVNLPGIESIIRQIQEGREFFRRHFRYQPNVAYNFDSFGHSGGLPQILTQAGYKMYIHMRPTKDDLSLPSDLYRWRGCDGSEILCYRIAVGLYHTEYENLEQRINEGIDLALRSNRDVPVFWGIGDHGGGATKSDLEKIDHFIQTEDRVNIIHSTPDLFYEAVRDTAKTAPVVQGDLQRVFTGCYTSLSRLKRAAQQNLSLLLQAETVSTLVWWIFDYDYPKSVLHRAWLDQMFNDFHDILPGTCIEPAEKDALNLYGSINLTSRELCLKAATVLNRRPSKDNYLPVVVLSTHTIQPFTPIEVECMISHRPKWEGEWHLRVYDAERNEIPSQEEQPEAMLPFNGWRRKVCFMAQLSQFGLTYFTMEAVRETREHRDCNPFLKYSINTSNGLIDQLSNGDAKNCLSGPLFKPIVVEDKGDAWGTDCWHYRKIIGEFKPDSESIRMIENGPIRRIHQVVMVYHNSKIVINAIVYAKLPVVEYRMRVIWHEEKKRLKLSIPTNFNTDHLYCEISGAAITHPADGQEHVHGSWFMLSDNDSAMGVVNSGQHGLDFKDGEVQLSVLRSAVYCHERGLQLEKYPMKKYMDQGEHQFSILVTVGEKHQVLESLPALSSWLNAPPLCYSHLPWGSAQSSNDKQENNEIQKPFDDLITLRPSNVRMLACKQSSDCSAMIIRFQECSGIPSTANLVLRVPVLHIQTELKAFEIKTIRIEKSGQWREVPLIEEI